MLMGGIPNLTGKPFEITREYFEDVGRLTGSEEINRILAEVSQSRTLFCEKTGREHRVRWLTL
jgi:hypothetical protein